MAARLKATVIQRQTITEQVHRRLKDAIINGEFEPGQHLVEGEIAARLGASRTPIREALSKLEQEGLVRPLRFGGLAVARLSERDVSELFSLISVLETYAVRLAAERATEKQIVRMESVCTRAEQLDESEIERLEELNQQFHRLLVEAADHKRLQELIGSLRSPMRPYRLFSLASSDFREQTVREHRAMVDAIRARKVDLVQELMREHLDLAERLAIARIRTLAKAAATGSEG